MSRRAFKLFLAGGMAAMLPLVSPSAISAPCGGFGDVDSVDVGDEFCTSVEWIKNRGVTLGCGVGVYCPSDPVNRLQMAAFMTRLGRVLSPAVTKVEASPGAINLDAVPTPRVCQTADIDGANPPLPELPGEPYPRRAFIHTTFSGLTAGPLQYRTDIQFSNDNGASWDFVWPNFSNFDGASSTHWVSSSHSGALDLEPDLPYRFAILIQRQGLGTDADFTASRCFVTVSVQSRTGSATPFDQGVVKPLDADH